MAVQSFAVPYAKEEPTTCGYCSPPGERSENATSYKVAGLHAMRLSCEVYQKMIDRGWRRSGAENESRLDALAFKSGRSHRKLVHRWNRRILQGDGDIEAAGMHTKEAKGKDNKPFDLVRALHSSEKGCLDNAKATHEFEVTLEPASFTKEKYNLFCKYQSDVHNDHEKSESGFKHFLVDSPLVGEIIPYTTSSDHLPPKYGSYHQMYRVDGKLIAVGVLDILPNCVSSVYFMYDSEWEHYSLGKDQLSALREVSLAKEIHDAGVPGMGYLYMGFYIYSCQKMRYKGEYSPSYLADPETYEWYPLETCIPLLQTHRYACFSNVEHCIEGVAPEISSEPALSELDDLLLLQRKEGSLTAVPVSWTNAWEIPSIKEDLCAVIEGLGLNLAQAIFWSV
ncbi:hypothetical protein D9611_014530 [Ephemerocybe angulata]|uniref:Arginyl-tRNA--protein transferase 1 n=1 Tax=Ephemerocybe angulata TaxID=980116 RepID=A0A8H5C9R0_9AGAR|nr:hypothetical protein D9611_014530 [Tulosesus angulatus]